MLKKTRNTFALLALAAIPFVLQPPPIDAFAVPDCSDGYARPQCQIWNIKYQVGVSSFVSCETGGDYKCSHPLIDNWLSNFGN